MVARKSTQEKQPDSASGEPISKKLLDMEYAEKELSIEDIAAIISLFQRTPGVKITDELHKELDELNKNTFHKTHYFLQEAKKGDPKQLDTVPAPAHSAYAEDLTVTLVTAFLQSCAITCLVNLLSCSISLKDSAMSALLDNCLNKEIGSTVDVNNIMPKDAPYSCMMDFQFIQDKLKKKDRSIKLDNIFDVMAKNLASVRQGIYASKIQGYENTQGFEHILKVWDIYHRYRVHREQFELVTLICHIFDIGFSQGLTLRSSLNKADFRDRVINQKDAVKKEYDSKKQPRLSKYYELLSQGKKPMAVYEAIATEEINKENEGKSVDDYQLSIFSRSSVLRVTINKYLHETWIARNNELIKEGTITPDERYKAIAEEEVKKETAGKSVANIEERINIHIARIKKAIEKYLSQSPR